MVEFTRSKAYSLLAAALLALSSAAASAAPPAAPAAQPVVRTPSTCAFARGDRRRIVWTHDDSAVIDIKGRTIEQMRIDDASSTVLVEVPGTGALDFDVSPDGAMLAYTQPGRIAADCAGFDPEIRTIRIADRSPQRRVHEPSGHFTSLRYSPDGRYLAANLKDYGATPKSQVLIYDQTMSFIGRFDDWGGILWRPDGRQLGIFSWNAISVWDASAWSEVKSIRRPEGRIGQVTWSPDGKSLAAWVESEKGCEADPSKSAIVVFDALTWTVSKTIPQAGRCATELAWNPKPDMPVVAGFVREALPKDAPKNAHPSYRIALWNTHGWQEVGGSPTGQDRAASIAWSHSGERIAVGFEEILVFELGDLGSPPGATNEPKSISADEIPSPKPAPLPPVAPVTPPSTTAPPPAPVAPTLPAPRTAPTTPAPATTSPAYPLPPPPGMVPPPPPPTPKPRRP